MNATERLVMRLGAVALIAALWAQPPAFAQMSDGASDGEAFTEVWIRNLSDPDLKAFYLRCSRAAIEQRLSGSEIALCSVGYELLLVRSFNGNFHALLAWSRGHDEHPAELAASSEPEEDRQD